MTRRVFSVSQINSYMRKTLEGDALLEGFFIEGEVSNYKPHSSGHLYFSLKDEAASINCVMFSPRLSFSLENGLKITAFAHAGIYEKTGALQLYVELIEPKGKGALYLSFEQLKERLSKEGLFDVSKKKPLPKFPHCVAIITSQTGAVIRDIESVARRRNKSVQLILVPVTVQGEGAVQQITEAISKVNAHGQADALIIARGGGSIEDLQTFNTEEVARAIYNSKIPTISAVGHETDFTIADFVADRRAPTPSAAAELLIPMLDELAERIKQIFALQTEILLRKVNHYREELEDMDQACKNILLSKCEKSQALLANSQRLLESLSPYKPLKKGFAMVFDEQCLLTQVAQVKEGQLLSIRLEDGSFKARVEVEGKEEDRRNENQEF